MSGPVFHVVGTDPAAEALRAFADQDAKARAPYLFDAGFANRASCIGESGTMSVSDIHRADGWDMLRCLAFELLDSLDRDAVRLGVQDEIRRAVVPEFHVLRTMQVYPRDRGTAGGPRGARATTTMTGRVPG